MAQLQTTSITGSFTVGNTEFTGSTGVLWYDLAQNVMQYTYSGSSGIQVKTLW